MRSARLRQATRISASPDAGSLILSRGPTTVSRLILVAVVYARLPQLLCRRSGAGRRQRISKASRIANSAGGFSIRSRPLPKAAGIHAAKVNWVVAASSSPPGLLASGKVPCVGQFTVGEPLLRAQAAPKKLARFAYSDARVSATTATASSLPRRRSSPTPTWSGALLQPQWKGLKSAIADPAGAWCNHAQGASGSDSGCRRRAEPRRLPNWRKSKVNRSLRSTLPEFRPRLMLSTGHSNSSHNSFSATFTCRASSRKEPNSFSTFERGRLANNCTVAVPDLVLNSYFPAIAAIALDFR